MLMYKLDTSKKLSFSRIDLPGNLSLDSDFALLDSHLEA